MIKKISAIYVTTLLVLFLCVPTYAQKTKSSSYDTYKIRRAENNTQDLLAQARALKNTDPAGALNIVKEALALSLVQEDFFSEAACYVLLGEINEGIEEWKLAFENYIEALQKLSGSYRQTVEYKITLRGLGYTSMQLGNYDKALTYFEETLSIKITPTERAERQLDISEVYYRMANFSNALQVLNKIPPSKVSGSSLSVKVENQRAKIYARMNKVDMAQGIYDKNIRQNKSSTSKKIAPKDEVVSTQSAKEEISNALVQQERYDDEIILRNQSIEYNTESNNFAEVSKDKVELSKALVATGKNSDAIKALEEATAIADTINNPNEQAKAFLALADLYEKNALNQEAIRAYKKYSNAIDKMQKQNQVKLVEKSDLIKKQKDIEELSKYVTVGQRDEALEQGTVFRQQLIIYGLLTIILIVVIASYFIHKNAQASKVANQLLALKSLRGQMNPHFIFNALNSVNHFIAQQDERTANKFLSEFSQLMRLVLENSQKDFIPLYKEQEILLLYLKLEHYRFRDKFEYEIKIDPSLNTEAVMLPPMLIQPYIENAVWHGLRYKENKGRLVLSIQKSSDHLIVEITDDGIGRKKSSELKTENQKRHTSTGLKNIEERLSIINKVYKSNYRVHVSDLTADRGGTRVQLFLPTNTTTNGNESDYY
jgi:tetratricopeptide (TPR) repeat protein